MRIDILHHDLEWAESQLEKELSNLGATVSLKDVRLAEPEDFVGADLVLNRVYASVANRDYATITETLRLLSELESQGISCENSHNTSLADYSKFFQSKLLEKAGVATPKTLVYSADNQTSVNDFAHGYGSPLVLKRDTGGRGKDVILCETLDDIHEGVVQAKARDTQYDGIYLVQEFVRPARTHDCRIGISKGKYVFSFGRTLIGDGTHDNLWLASTSRGSEKFEYNPSEDELELAIRATNAIGASYNEVDMTFTDKGPVIIENNPTPNYVKKQDEDKVAIYASALVGKLR